MTVYVDDMRADFGRMKMCHMIADSETELLVMADKIGVQRKWHQHALTPGSHFDIAMSKRALAVENGAVEITWRQAGAMTGLRRRGLPMGDPETAMDRYMAARAEAASEKENERG